MQSIENFSIKVISSSCWESSEKGGHLDSELKYIPEMMQGCKSLFENFYNNNHNGTRKLVWKFSTGHVDMELKGRKTAKIQVNVIQAAACFAIELKKAFTLPQLNELIGIKDDSLKAGIDKLIEKKILKLGENGIIQIDGEFDFPAAVIDCQPRAVTKKSDDEVFTSSNPSNQSKR